MVRIWEREAYTRGVETKYYMSSPQEGRQIKLVELQAHIVTMYQHTKLYHHHSEDKTRILLRTSDGRLPGGIQARMINNM